MKYNVAQQHAIRRVMGDTGCDEATAVAYLTAEEWDAMDAVLSFTVDRLHAKYNAPYVYACANGYTGSKVEYIRRQYAGYCTNMARVGVEPLGYAAWALQQVK